MNAGTDRVELTEECAEDLWLELYGDLRNAIKALADQWEQRGNKREDLGWDRCAEELRALLHAEGEYDDLLGRGEYAEPSSDELIAKNAALQARLDAVTALADEWEERAEARRTHKTHREWKGDDGVRLSGYVSDNPRNDAEGSVFDTCSTRLRAALTPEGTE